MNNKEIKKFWEETDEKMSHLDKEYTTKAYDSWHKLFIDKINWKNKTVIDYGIGGGYLGKLLFEKHNIKKYIGIDIAERQLEFAKETLKEYEKKTEYYLTPIRFNKLSADIIVSQAVIQHFPDEKYLISFLRNVNTSKAKVIMLQIRHSLINTFNDDYTSREKVRTSCWTNSEFINNYLSKYNLEYKSEVSSGAHYQFLIYKIKK